MALVNEARIALNRVGIVAGRQQVIYVLHIPLQRLEITPLEHKTLVPRKIIVT